MLIAQAMVLGAIALGLAFAAFARTANQLHLVQKALDAEQDAVMLDALEQLTDGQDRTLTCSGWDELSVTKQVVRARAAGRAPVTRTLAAPEQSRQAP